MIQYLIAETRDCSPIQSQRIFAAYEAAWDAIRPQLGRGADRERLGKLLLDAIVDEIDTRASQEAIVEASLARLGFRGNYGRRAEIH